MLRAFNWLFRNQRTGKLVIVQFPNLPLMLFFFTVGFRRIVHPTGTSGAVVNVLSTILIVWWAVDEAVRGASRFRRLLGAFVLAFTVVTLAF